MFGPSPIKPIEEHMHKVHRCVKLLYPFFEAVNANNWEEAANLYDQISSLEKVADLMKKDLRSHLPSGLFLPVPRGDLLELLTCQDKLANKAQDIAGLILGRTMSLPPSIQPLFMPCLQLGIDASKQACKAINELDELLESGFRGSEIKIVENMIIKLDKLEQQSDVMLKKVRAEVFNLESQLSAVNVIFLYKVVEWTGQLADCAQTVGGRLQILIAR